MEEDKFGIPRPFIENGKGPAGFDRPLTKGKEERLLAELEAMAVGKNRTDAEFQRLINMLSRNGFEDQADVVRSVRDGEKERVTKLQNVLGVVRRELETE